MCSRSKFLGNVTWKNHQSTEGYILKNAYNLSFWLFDPHLLWTWSYLCDNNKTLLKKIFYFECCWTATKLWVQKFAHWKLVLSSSHSKFSLKRKIRTRWFVGRLMEHRCQSRLKTDPTSTFQPARNTHVQNPVYVQRTWSFDHKRGNASSRRVVWFRSANEHSTPYPTNKMAV